jgi:hypothetical protein
MKLLTEITTDEHLEKLLPTTGFLVNVDYPTRDVKLHKIHCKYCNPSSSIGVKPSSKRLNKTGEFWYSNNRNEANSKAEEISSKRGYNYSLCAICNP